MKGVQLTQMAPNSKKVWVPLSSIACVWPFLTFTGEEKGTQIALNNNGSLEVEEDYEIVIRLLEGDDNKRPEYVDDDESYA